MSDDEYHEAGAGSAHVIPTQCSTLRKGGHVMLKGHPCKIVEMTTSKTGKHGHAKVHIVALDVFDNKKYEENCPSTHNIDKPNVSNKTYEITDENDGYLTLMDDEGNLKEDLKYNEELCKSMSLDKIKNELKEDKKDLMATVTFAIGREEILEVKIKDRK